MRNDDDDDDLYQESLGVTRCIRAGLLHLELLLGMPHPKVKTRLGCKSPHWDAASQEQLHWDALQRIL